MEILKKLVKWVLLSSENPEKISLTLKGLIPFILIVLGWAKFGGQIDASLLSQGADNLVNLVVSLGEVISACVGAYGLIRKIFNSLHPPVVG